MKVSSIVFFAALFLLFAQSVHAASLHGVVYKWDSMEEVPALVKVYDGEALIVQAMCDSNGTYNLTLSPGNYTVYAVYQKAGETFDFITELSLSNDLKMDIPLLPATSDIFVTSSLPPYKGVEVPAEELSPHEESTPPDYTGHLFVAFLVVLLLAVIFFLKKRTKPKIQSDEEIIIDLIKKEGGRTLQSKLLEKTGFSAAKVSLITSKLEKENKIKKTKRGREKIIELTS